MASLHPLSRVPAVPPQAATRWKVAVSSATIAGFTRVADHLVAWRFLREAHLIIEHAELGWPIEWVDPEGLPQTVHLPWRSSERAQHVAVFIDYIATSEAKDQVASITAELRTVTGAVVDVGCKWTYLSGTLPARGWFNGVPFPITHVTTGLSRDDSPVMPPTRPRVLNLNGKGGDWLDLVLTTENARIISVTLREVFEEVQDQ